MAQKPQKKQNGRIYRSISISIPPELEARLNAEAAERGMSRSEYVVSLVEADLRKKGLLPKRTVPPRIGRARKGCQPKSEPPKNPPQGEPPRPPHAQQRESERGYPDPPGVALRAARTTSPPAASLAS
jgi:hypothetical protein